MTDMPRTVLWRRRIGARILNSRMYRQMRPRWCYDLCHAVVWPHLYLIRCDHCGRWSGDYKEAIGDEFWCSRCRHEAAR